MRGARRSPAPAPIPTSRRYSSSRRPDIRSIRGLATPAIRTPSRSTRSPPPPRAPPLAAARDLPGALRFAPGSRSDRNRGSGPPAFVLFSSDVRERVALPAASARGGGDAPCRRRPLCGGCGRRPLRGRTRPLGPPLDSAGRRRRRRPRRAALIRPSALALAPLCCRRLGPRPRRPPGGVSPPRRPRIRPDVRAVDDPQRAALPRAPAGQRRPRVDVLRRQLRLGQPHLRADGPP